MCPFLAINHSFTKALRTGQPNYTKNLHLSDEVSEQVNLPLSPRTSLLRFVYSQVKNEDVKKCEQKWSEYVTIN